MGIFSEAANAIHPSRGVPKFRFYCTPEGHLVNDNFAQSCIVPAFRLKKSLCQKVAIYCEKFVSWSETNALGLDFPINSALFSHLPLCYAPARSSEPGQYV